MIIDCETTDVFEAAVARVDVTPPAGIRLIGYAVREGLSHGIDEPLTLTVMVLRGANSTIAIIALDACIVYVPFASKLREHCAASIGIPASNVLLNFSHTHCSPATDGYLDYDTPDQLACRRTFGN